MLLRRSEHTHVCREGACVCREGAHACHDGAVACHKLTPHDCVLVSQGLMAQASFRGALLAAGTGDVGLLSELEASWMRSMFTTKVLGTWSVHCATSTAQMDARVHFSSLGPLLGNAKLGNYAAANACLDVLAVSFRARGLAACSAQWPGVSDAGIGAEWYVLGMCFRALLDAV